MLISTSRRCILVLLTMALTLSLLPALCGSALAAGVAKGGGAGGIATLSGRFSAAILVDADTGEVLAALNPHARRQPASMLKMMTELLVLESVAEGSVSLDDSVTVSALASKMGGSQVFLKQGERFTVEELLQALSIHSANDAAVALAEHVAGRVEAFVDLMNMRARELGMHDTEFHSVHGLPPGRGQKPDQTSAFDLALLARELARHPEALRWGSTVTAPFRDGKFTLYNPNKLVGKYRGLDGLKTGYHRQSGFCVTATAVQRNKRLISVVMGAPTNEARATETARLLTYGFNLYTPVTVLEKGRTLLDQKLDVKGGKRGEVTLAYVGPLVVSVRKDAADGVSIEPKIPDKVAAPVKAGLQIGTGVALWQGQPIGEVPIVTVEDVPRGNWLERLFKH